MRGLRWLLAGIGIGTVTALLSAPYTGEEIRFALRRGYRRAVKRIGRHTEDLRDGAKNVIDHAQNMGEDVGKQGRKLLRRLRAA